MITCKFIKNRHILVSYNEEERFDNIHSHYFFIGYIKEGCTILLIDGERCFLGQNMLICLEPGRLVKPLGSYRLKAYSVSFAPEFLNKNLTYEFIRSNAYHSLCRKEYYPDLSLFLRHDDICNGVLPLDTKTARTAFRLIQQIIHQFRHQPNKEWSCRARVFVFIFIEVFQPLYKQFLECGELQDQFILDVIAYIHREINSTITIQKLCTRFHINRNTLNQRFRKTTGLSVIDYVIQRRISLAKYSLAFTELTIQEIAEACGFKEQTYFTKVFKQHVGIVPTLYRTNARKNRPFKECDASFFTADA